MGGEKSSEKKNIENERIKKNSKYPRTYVRE